MSERALSRAQFEKHLVRADEIQEGDRLDKRGKVRVHATSTRAQSDTTFVAYRVRGSKAPGTQVHPSGKQVAVFRPVQP